MAAKMSDNEKRYSGSDNESAKPPLLIKKKKKTEKPGYKMFEADESDEETVLYDDTGRTPTAKLKKHSRPSFKFTGKIKLKEKEKDDKKEAVDKRDEREARRMQSKKVKDNKDKEPKFRKKKDKLPHSFGRKSILLASAAKAPVEAATPVFGVALSQAVETTPSYDGVQLPVVVRECIDYIEEHGLLYEGIYRISGVKSKVQMLKDAYNRQASAYLYEHDPSIVASLLKQFIRELPESLLTSELAPKFEEASVVQQEALRVKKLKHCISSLPACNRELLSWMIVHMNHVIAKEKINKMSLQNVSIVLSPTMRVSHRVLNVLFQHSNQLFAHVNIARYRPPLQPAASKWSVDLPEDESAVRSELEKQEALLSQLHHELHGERFLTTSSIADKEELVWEVQRNVTQLKRKLKLIAKTKAARQQEQQQLSADAVKQADPNRRSINAAELNFALQTGSLRRSNKSSQVELASSPSSVSTSTEALAIQHRPADMLNKSLRFSHRSSTSSDPSKSCQEDSGGGEPVKAAADLELVINTGEELHSSTAEDTVVKLQGGGEITRTEIEEKDDTVGSGFEIVESIDTSGNVITSGPGGVVGEMSDEVERNHVQMKVSTSQDSDVTVFSCASDHATVSASHQNLSEEANQLVSKSSVGEDKASEDSLEHRVDLSYVHDPQLFIDGVGTSQSEFKGNQTNPSEPDRSTAKADTTELPQSPTNVPSILLIPEKLHAATSIQHDLNAESSDVYSIADDDELRLLIAEEAQLIWEEEELIAIKDELRQKIDTETIEIDRLHEEIAEYEELRSITTLGHSSEAMSSDGYYTSTSDTDPEDEEAAMAELDSLVMQLHSLTELNDKLEAENCETVKKIHDERLGCVNVKIQIRLLQQQMLSCQAEEQSLI